MGVMSNQQRVAARRAMGEFPDLLPDLVEGDEYDEITPYLKDDPEQRGEAVRINRMDDPNGIERRLKDSCEGLAFNG